MTIHIGVGGAWKEVLPGTAIGVGGANKEITGVWVGVGGAWKRAFGGVVTLSGETVESTATDPANATARIVFNSDGTVDKFENGSITQVDASTDWIIPNSAAPDDYEIRFTALTGDTPTVTGSTAEDAWFALSGGNFSLTLIQGTAGGSNCSFTIEIRKGSSGAALDSATYSLSATVN